MTLHLVKVDLAIRSPGEVGGVREGGREGRVGEVVCADFQDHMKRVNCKMCIDGYYRPLRIGSHDPTSCEVDLTIRSPGDVGGVREGRREGGRGREGRWFVPTSKTIGSYDESQL